MITTRIPARVWPAWRGRLSLFKVSVLVSLHLLAALAPFRYGRLELALFLLTTYVTLQFGLALGYHRLLSHRSFSTHRGLRRWFGLIGTLAAQSGPLSWVANHRLHHRVTDRDLDPHAPGHGFAWAHLVWGLFEHPITTDPRQRQRFVKDLQKDAFLVFCEEHFVALNCAAVASVFLAGFVLGGVARGVSFVAWVIALRVVCAWHITFLTNSVGHKWGYRNFDTPDQSRNVWFLGIVALGDGWHNNHHRFASCARHGRRWFELDLSYRIIVLMESAGVAWGVHHMEEVRRHAVQGDTIRTPQPSGDHHLQPT